ncbi:MAG: hypothetical protein EA417_02640 [Gammaproteobacteria bacterium]|nr:MAG: hypothetical protein EA417_02640 [Gammaproteobacteria bacterium]
MKMVWMLPVLLALTGCWNENWANNVRLGDVSIGQQMIDLQRAREAGAIDDEEHARLREALMSLTEVCGKPQND